MKFLTYASSSNKEKQKIQDSLYLEEHSYVFIAVDMDQLAHSFLGHLFHFSKFWLFRSPATWSSTFIGAHKWLLGVLRWFVYIF